MSDHSSIPMILKTSLLAASLAFIAWSGTKCLAALNNFRAEGYLEAWQNQRMLHPGYQAPEAEFTNGLNASLRSLKLAPYNSNYHRITADILLWQVVTNANLLATDKQRLRAEIIQHYHTAISLQPFWAYHYAHFADTKAQLGEVDQEMTQALHNANRFGAHETYIMHVIVELGLRFWPQLDQNTQLLVANAIDRIITLDIREDSAAREKVFALSTIGLYQRKAAVCPLLKTQSEQITIMCKPTIKPDSAKAHT